MKIIIIVLVLVAAYIQYNNAKEESHARVKRAYIEYSNTNTSDTNKISNSNNSSRSNNIGFTCDGRTHCSQMRSCAEATYFLNNCPNTQMDGDFDGIPCEQQWC